MCPKYQRLESSRSRSRKTAPACRGSKSARPKGYGPSRAKKKKRTAPIKVVRVDVLTTNRQSTAPERLRKRWGMDDPSVNAATTVPSARPRSRLNHVETTLRAGG